MMRAIESIDNRERERAKEKKIVNKKGGIDHTRDWRNSTVRVPLQGSLTRRHRVSSPVPGMV